MYHQVFTVVAINRRWFADCGDIRHGPYTSADTATLVASNEARAASRNTHAVKISIQDESGNVCNEFFVGPESKAVGK